MKSKRDEVVANHSGEDANNGDDSNDDGNNSFTFHGGTQILKKRHATTPSPLTVVLVI
ncbi:hypothetical protein SESBI_01377 [Sesbania bispinosa]|nr:hypothetical protein SESBI_01377 [Sesbania bispinosa]